MITRDRVLELLDYDPETGVFLWKPKTASDFTNSHFYKKHLKFKAGKPVGVSNVNYQRIHLDGRQYNAHRLAWLIVYGEWPLQVDHINGNRADNRICNLRDAPQKENAKNLGIGRNNKSGVLGVHWSKSNNAWVAQIRVSYRVVHLGSFNSIEEAAAARASAENEYGFHANHGRRVACTVAARESEAV